MLSKGELVEMIEVLLMVNAPFNEELLSYLSEEERLSRIAFHEGEREAEIKRAQRIVDAWYDEKGDDG